MKLGKVTFLAAVAALGLLGMSNGARADSILTLDATGLKVTGTSITSNNFTSYGGTLVFAGQASDDLDVSVSPDLVVDPLGVPQDQDFAGNFTATGSIAFVAGKIVATSFLEFMVDDANGPANNKSDIIYVELSPNSTLSKSGTGANTTYSVTAQVVNPSMVLGTDNQYGGIDLSNYSLFGSGTSTISKIRVNLSADAELDLTLNPLVTSSAPIPAAAWTGIGTLGLMGLVGFIRNRRMKLA